MLAEVELHNSQAVIAMTKRRAVDLCVFACLLLLPVVAVTHTASDSTEVRRAEILFEPPFAPDGTAAVAPATEPKAIPLVPTQLPIVRFGETRLRHPAPVKSLVLTPDGKVLATTSHKDPIIRLWDVATGLLIRGLRIDVNFTDSVTAIGFAPDNRRLIVIRHGNSMAKDSGPAWHEPATVDTVTGTITRWPWGSESDYYLPSFALSADGKTVAGVDQGGEVKVWDANTGRELRVLGKVKGNTIRPFRGVCFSPDGTHLAACSDEQAVYVGPVDGSRPLAKFPVDVVKREVRSVFWPRADRLVALWYDGLAALDPTTGRQLAKADAKGNMISNSRAAGGELLFVKPDSDKHLIAIDPTTLAPVPDRVYRGSRRDEPFAASADGKILALATGHVVRLFDATTGAPLHPDLDRYPTHPAERLQVSADGRRLLAEDRIWDLTAPHLTTTLTAAATGWRETRIAPPASWVKVFPGTTEGLVSPDGRRAAVGGWKTLAVREMDPAADWFVLAEYPNRSPKCGFDVPSSPLPLAFSPDGRWLLTRDHDLAIWNVTGLPICVARLPPVYWWQVGACTDFSPDGRRLATADVAQSGETSIRIWETISGSEVVRLTPANGASGCAFTPDGKRLVVANTDTTFGVWDYSRLEARSLTPIAGDNWELLIHPNAKVGLAVVDALVADPATALFLLKTRLSPIDPARLRQLVDELSDEDFEARERAGDDLAKLGSQAEGALSEAAKSPSPEASRRAVRLLRGIKPSVRTIRAVEVAERIGNAEARELLTDWTNRNNDLLLQSEAKAALDRIAPRPRGR